MTEEEQQQVILWGNKAKTLLEDPNFNDLCLFRQTQLSNQIMASHLSQKDYREDQFVEYAGMRSFIHNLVDLAEASQNILKARDEDFINNSADDADTD